MTTETTRRSIKKPKRKKTTLKGIESSFSGVIPAAYINLIRTFPIRSIRSEKDLNSALQILDQLLAKGNLSEGEEWYLDALTDVVAAYEEKHYVFAPATDAEMLRHLMEAKGVSQSELHQKTQIPKSTISEILSGKKAFTRQLIAKLAHFFEMDKGVLAQNL